MGRPAFLVIGAQKAGTTSLYAWLSRHPGVNVSQTKELHFFDQHFHRGVAWYEQNFSGRCAGEATPYYLYHPLAAQRAAAVVPEAKLIVLLREPVSRAWSHYHHVRRHGFEPLSFGDALAIEGLRLHGEADKIQRDPRYFSLNHQKYSYLSRGMYAAQIAVWLRHYPRERMLFLESDTLRSAPQAALDRVSDFLGVHRAQLPSFPSHNKGGGYPALDPAAKANLQRQFAPHNAQLARLLGADAPRFAREALQQEQQQSAACLGLSPG